MPACGACSPVLLTWPCETSQPIRGGAALGETLHPPCRTVHQAVPFAETSGPHGQKPSCRQLLTWPHLHERQPQGRKEARPRKAPIGWLHHMEYCTIHRSVDRKRTWLPQTGGGAGRGVWGNPGFSFGLKKWLELHRSSCTTLQKFYMPLNGACWSG